MFITIHSNLHLYLALLWMTISSAAMAIADVTIDACTAYNSIKHPSLASDMQSLCSLSSSIGALLGFFMSGILVHLVGSKVSESCAVISAIRDDFSLMPCFVFRH